MKQPDALDNGTKMDVVHQRLNVAREDLDGESLRQRKSIMQVIMIPSILLPGK